jgi:hypothetical protein
VAETLAGLAALPDSLTVNGRTLTLYPLTMADVGAWNRWARAQFLEPALLACAALEGEARQTALRDIFDEAKSISFWDRPSFELMDSTEGRIKLLALSLAHGPAPAPTEHQLRTIFEADGIRQHPALGAAMWLIYALSGYVSHKTYLDVTGKIGGPPLEKKQETPPTAS